ncbi:PAS domain-containing protein [Desertibaculum subflavum]|uniref:PAS domain-containing protein n=1 Tax=Desertibaculum subflavum TaxID=2268458 RepID=UPI000E674004
MTGGPITLPERPALTRLRRLHQHWVQLCGDRPLPSPDQFDILTLPQLMGYLHIVEVEGEPPRFRFRLFGTRIAEIGGRDLTGRWVDDIEPPRWAEAVQAAFLQPLTHRLPCYSRSDDAYDLGAIEMHRLACPFSSNGHDIDRLLVGVEAIPRPHFTGKT